MMYVEFMKIFLLALIQRADGCWSHFDLLSPKTLDSYFLDKMYVEFMKNFLLADSSELMALSHFGLQSSKTLDSYFLDKLYVEFMKNFLLADSSELLAVRLISVS